MADQQRCNELLEEYRMLRRRTEGVRMIGRKARPEDLEALGIDEREVERLVELEDILEAECLAYLPEGDKMRIPRDNGS